MVGTWLGEIRSCSCLAVQPDSAWVLLNKIYQPFFTSLYIIVLLCICYVHIYRPAPCVAEAVMLCGAVARVGDLVGLDDEAERVADEERQHDRHQDHRRLLAPLPDRSREGEGEEGSV